MKYDFITVPDRRHSGSSKWKQMYQIKPDVDEDVVPLSTADMEFFNAPEIVEGLQEYVGKTVLGYTDATDSYTEAVIGWMKKRHNYEVEKEWIIQSPGVVPALGTAVNAYTEPGEGVLILTPIYFPMTMTIQMKGRRLVESPLILTDKGYEIDFEDLEKKAALPDVKLMLFCSPHNPIGRVWSREELGRVMDICIRNHVFIIDDEIHNDLIMPGYEHIVMATLSKEAAMNCAVCTAPSKTFNLAGMQTSNIIIANPVMRAGFMAEKMSNFSMSLNAAGYEACRLAYTKCEAWLDECIQVIAQNAKYVEDFMKEKLPECKVYPLQGTYLQWVDFRPLGLTHVDLEEFMQQEAQIFMDEGYMFGKAARGFERFNLACPASVIKAAMDRLYKAVLRCRPKWEAEGKLNHTALKKGERMPDFIYDSPYESGKSFLSDSTGKRTALIFSRYYTCGLCQSLLSELSENADKLKEKELQVKIVLQSTPESVREALGEENPYPFEIICDPTQSLYKRFEVFPAGMMEMMAMGGLKQMMMDMAGNPNPVKPEGNQAQLPALFMIDEEGNICHAEYPATMTGLPGVDEMCDLMA